MYHDQDFSHPRTPAFSLGLGTGLLLGGLGMLAFASTMLPATGFNFSPIALAAHAADFISTATTAILPWLRSIFILAAVGGGILMLAAILSRPAKSTPRVTTGFSGRSTTQETRKQQTSSSQPRYANGPATLPSPLVRHAEELLRQAHTVPNFTTTPFSGQQRVLAKLAYNFVPEAQRTAAVTLALFRLRRPAAFA